MVTRSPTAKPRDLRADGNHRAGSLVAHDDGQLDAKGILAQVVEVGRADHGRAGLDQQLVVADGRQVTSISATCWMA